MRPFPVLAALVLAQITAACGDSPTKTKKPPVRPVAQGSGYYAPVSHASLPGWTRDDFSGFLRAFRKGCNRLMAMPDAREITPRRVGGTAGQWKPACREAAALDITANAATVRAFLESRFKVYRVYGRSGDKGKFTGYYEIELAGVLTPKAGLQTPAYAPPKDLVTARLGDFARDLAGRRISGRVKASRMQPYDTRAVIDSPDWAQRTGARVLFYGDAADVFFLHVQGSGVVRFPDGRRQRVGYAADNGHEFVGIGRLLLKRKLIPRSEASAQGIKRWIRRNPARAAKLMAENPRYIFFRFIEGEGPIGAMGAPLTPERSLAVDPRSIPLGAPVWLDTTMPSKPDQPLQRMMVAQDTGGAIKGVVRGDFYWGTGDSALAQAGRMNQQGRFFVLIPKEIKVDVKLPADPGS